MSVLDGAKAAALLFVAAVIQVSVLNSVTVIGGTPDLLLITLCAVALLRGSIFGAVGGFFAGLIVDTATLETMGVTALLLTLAGYWIGRYGETTGRGRHAPVLSVGVVTILYAFGALLVRYLLGQGGSPRVVLLDALPPSLLFNLLLAIPVFLFCRWVLSLGHDSQPVREVRLIE
ncbi:MAG: rod shape-determining protein MreD [Actinobacteria bacterium]|nr:rod shape-determining protein MreD [Actinomycetota bacterium]